MRPGKNKIRRTHYVDLNKLVWKFFKDCQESGIRVNGKNLKDQAMKYAKVLGLETFRGSEGWLDSFKRRHRIDLRSMTGCPVSYEEDGDGDDEELDEATNSESNESKATAYSESIESKATACFTDIQPLDISNLLHTEHSNSPSPSTSVNTLKNMETPDIKITDDATVMNMIKSCTLRHKNKDVQYAFDIIRAYILSQDPTNMSMLVSLQEKLMEKSP